MTTPVLSSSTLTGDPIRNRAEEQLGSVEEIMIDLDSGRVAYLVMASGGILGMGEKDPKCAAATYRHHSSATDCHEIARGDLSSDIPRSFSNI